MKYKKRNRIKFDKKLDFSTGGFLNKKNLTIAGVIILILALFYILPKLSRKEKIDINGGENIVKDQKEQIVEEIFMEDLDVKTKKIDLEKNYGIKEKEMKVEVDTSSKSDELSEESFKEERAAEKGMNTYKNDSAIYEYLKSDEEKE